MTAATALTRTSAANDSLPSLRVAAMMRMIRLGKGIPAASTTNAVNTIA
jgi:hypothetical protein